MCDLLFKIRLGLTRKYRIKTLGTLIAIISMIFVPVDYDENSLVCAEFVIASSFNVSKTSLLVGICVR